MDNVIHQRWLRHISHIHFTAKDKEQSAASTKAEPCGNIQCMQHAFSILLKILKKWGTVFALFLKYKDYRGYSSSH